MPPGPPSGHKGAAYADVASANSTLNTLMPGRQKSWMTNAHSQPNPRWSRPSESGLLQARQQTLSAQRQQAPPQSNPGSQVESGPQGRPPSHQPQQSPSTPANVLPSPAPSDEPSPAALSNYKDSPNPQTTTLTSLSRGQLNPVPSNLSIAANPNTEISSPQAAGADYTVLSPLAQTFRSPLAMPPPDLPNGSQVGSSHGEANLPGQGLNSAGLGYVRANPIENQEQPNKRRRVEAPSKSIPFAELAASINNRIAQIGGYDKLTTDVEAPRFTLLKDACARGDIFYLHLHRLHCLWSYDAQSLPPVLLYDLDATQRGFAIVETVLKSNSGLSRDNLKWCAAFAQKTLNECDPEGADKIAKFLKGLSQYWPTLSPACFNRLYPYLVDELLGQLQCYSVCMQNILFTASRRRLGIPDGRLGDQVQELFRLDQEQHMDEEGSFRQVVLSEDSEQLERRNMLLIRAYRDVWSKAKAAEQGRVDQDGRLHQQQPQQQQQQQFQQQDIERQAARQQNAVRVQQMRQALIAQQQQRQQQQQHQAHSDQGMLIAQQQSQMANRMGLGQQHAQMRQSHTAQQQQLNLQWFQGQMQAAVASHARRPSMNAHQQSVQPSNQHFQRPQSSGTFSGAEDAAIFQNSFVSQHVGPHFQTMSPDLILSSNSPASPTMPGRAQAQYQLSLPQQQQQQAMPGQNLIPFAPWSASTPSPTIPQSPQMPNVQSADPSLSSHMGVQQAWNRPQSRAALQSQNLQSQMSRAQMPQQQMRQLQSMQQQHHQQMRQHQMRQQSSQHLRQPQVGRATAQQATQIRNPLVPPSGHVIDRSEHPHSHQEKKSLLMSLHQVNARSPDRTRRNGDADERYYQSVHSFAVRPLRLAFYHEVTFEVSPDQFSRLCKQKTLPQLSGGNASQPRVPLQVREYGDHSLRFRVRCCRLRSEQLAIPESEWVTKDMSWPDHIFVHVNEQKLTIRRGTHNGKDLPIELTDFILAGKNTIKVAVPRTGPTAGGKQGIFFLAVEIIEIASHAALMSDIESNRRVQREETLGKIRTRVDAAPGDDDEIAVIDRTGSTARELSISLTDPFSASIFRVPARGATCTHLECFDLETWLTTRPAKQQIKCGHRDVCTCTKRLEPTEPDKWKCPICFEDARPGSLRIDSFLEDVRKHLEKQNHLDVKSILVAGDGTWRPVEEPDDDDDEGSDGDGPANVARRSTSALRRSAPVVEVIELD